MFWILIIFKEFLVGIAVILVYLWVRWGSKREIEGIPNTDNQTRELEPITGFSVLCKLGMCNAMGLSALAWKEYPKLNVFHVLRQRFLSYYEII